MEFEKLVKLARHCSEIDACITCPVGGCEGTTGIMNRLADAIEELNKEVNKWQEIAYDWRDEYYHLLDNTPSPKAKEEA